MNSMEDANHPQGRDGFTGTSQERTEMGSLGSNDETSSQVSDDNMDSPTSNENLGSEGENDSNPAPLSRTLNGERSVVGRQMATQSSSVGI